MSNPLERQLATEAKDEWLREQLVLAALEWVTTKEPSLWATRQAQVLRAAAELHDWRS